MISLYNEKKNCCSCMACMNICPKQAIIRKHDENGFIFPQIIEDLLIRIKTYFYQVHLVGYLEHWQV